MKIYEASLKYTFVKEVSSSAMSTPEGVVRIMKDSFEERPNQETFWLVTLNRRNKVINKHLHSIGAITSSLVCLPTVFKTLLLDSCTAFIVCHNHPSGDPAPSKADIQVTKSIRDGAKLLGLEFMDHIIYGDKSEDINGIGYYSFRGEAGLI